MAFQFVTEAWEDGHGNRFRGDPGVPETWGPKTQRAFPSGRPRSPRNVYGVFVRAYDPKTGETHRFWNFVYRPFTSWDEWITYIGIMMGQHGMELE